MSLSNALNAARNGLATTQGLSQITSGNISNSMTPGYVRRTAILVSSGAGEGGAVIGQVRREVDASLVRLSRQEDGKMARQQAIYEGLRGYTIHLGQPGSGTSPADKFSAFQASMTTLVNTPASVGAQSGAVMAAEDLALTIREASDMLGSTRAEVDMEIRYEVADLNQALYDLRALNLQSRDTTQGSLLSTDFQDKIDILVDTVSQIIDVRVTQSSDGIVNLYTSSGAALLEGQLVHDVTYTPSDGTLKAGNQDITPNRSGVRGIEQGSLSGLFELHQQIIPRFQLQLDEFARGLMEAFENNDTTLAAGQAGLFTDNGAAFDPSNLEGLASRLKVNDLVSLNGSNEVWRIRDGLGAAAQGDASDATMIQGFLDSFGQAVGADPNTGLPSTTTLQDFAAEFVTNQAAEQSRAQSRFNAASSALEVVRSARSNVEGVNIDEEMQNLLLIEQSYAANSRMLKAVSDMMDTLLAAV
ncbi:MAG: flagellar hook-associated protein FlgK [Brevirhabdus sp.]